MSKVTMPEPDAYLYMNGDQRGVSLHFRSDQDIAAGTTRHGLITTTQAEAYKDACVREALDEALEALTNAPGETANVKLLHARNAIRARILLESRQ